MCLAVTHAVTQQQTQNKTKRGLTEQTRTFHEADTFKPLILYPELAAAGASHSETYAESPRSLAPSPTLSTSFETEPPKQVTAQQVLYEYQQTPSTTISNVHVNQQFQTVPTPETANTQVVYASQLPPASPTTQFVNNGHNLEAQQNQHSLSVQNVVQPVQHSSLIKHGQGYGQVTYQPSAETPPPQTRTSPIYQPTRNQPPQAPLNHQYIPSNVQPTQSSFYSSTQQFPQQPNPFSQGKYLYVNGKILYYPQGVPTTPVVPSTPYPGTLARHPAITYQNHQQKPLAPLQKPTKRPVAPSQQVTQYYNTFTPTKLTQPSTTQAPVAPVKEVQREEQQEEEEEPEKKPKARPVEEEEEEEEEDEEDVRPIRYYLDDDDDDDEDEYERPTKFVPKYYRSKYLAPDIEEAEEEDDDDDDSNREQSEQVKQKAKQPKKYYRGDVYLKPTKEKNKYQNSEHFIFFDPLKEDPKKASYTSHSEPEPKYSKVYATYKSPQKKKKSKKASEATEEPQLEYTLYKYHKVEPQKEDSEGRFSENVPVIHTQKVVKKHWVVTKTD